MKNTLTNNEAQNLLDALEEWNEVCEPKELEENEVGLNCERYEKLKNKLEAIND
jgi:hypothetical protein